MTVDPHLVTGRRDEVVRAIQTARTSGALVGFDNRPIKLPDGRIAVTVFLRSPEARSAAPVEAIEASPVASSRPRWRYALLALPAAMLALIVIGTLAAIEFVMAHGKEVVSTVILFVLAALALLSIVGKVRGCSGLHCSGCRRH